MKKQMALDGYDGLWWWDAVNHVSHIKLVECAHCGSYLRDKLIDGTLICWICKTPITRNEEPNG